MRDMEQWADNHGYQRYRHICGKRGTYYSDSGPDCDACYDMRTEAAEPEPEEAEPEDAPEPHDPRDGFWGIGGTWPRREEMGAEPEDD